MIDLTSRNKVFIEQLDISIEAISVLGQGVSEECINRELDMVRDISLNMTEPISLVAKRFSSLLWTLLGEISIPHNLGETVYEKWPVLVFPFSMKDEAEISNYIVEAGFSVVKREFIPFTKELHACLYGGQPWYDSLRFALDGKGVWNEDALLLWMEKGEETHCSLAAIARKLQLQLRPKLKSYEFKNGDLKYPAILKAFHTPHLGNVEVHTYILSGGRCDQEA